MKSATEKLRRLKADPSLAYGAITLDLSEQWEAKELARLLLHSASCYERVNTAIWFHSQLIREYTPDGPAIIEVPADLRRLLEEGDRGRSWETITKPGTIRLTINRVHLASPGWIEMIGNWNPLKLILEFITKWRAENTKRSVWVDRSDLDRRAQDIEMMKLMLDAAKQCRDKRASELIEIFNQHMLIVPLRDAADIASDTKVPNVRLRRLSTTTKLIQ